MKTKYNYKQVRKSLEKNGFVSMNDMELAQDAHTFEETFMRIQNNGLRVYALVNIHRNTIIEDFERGKATINEMCPIHWANVYLKEFNIRNN